MHKSMKALLGISAPLWAMHAAANPILTIGSVFVSGNSGHFSVHLSNPSGIEQIAGYTTSFVVTPEAGSQGSISFTSLAAPPARPLFGTQVATLGLGNTNYYTINDIDNTAPGYIVGGDNTELTQVNFSFSNGATGKFDVALLTTDAGNVPHSELDLPTGSSIATAQFTTTPAVIATPEPTSLSFICAGAALLLGSRQARRR